MPEWVKICLVILGLILVTLWAAKTIKKEEADRRAYIMKHGKPATATLMSKRDNHIHKGGSYYYFYIMYSNNKSTTKTDTVDFGMDIKVLWPEHKMDFDLISTEIKVGSKIYEKYNKEDKLPIFYLPEKPKEEVIVAE